MTMLDMPGALGDLDNLSPEEAGRAVDILTSDWWYRMTCGRLYKIKTKEEQAEDGQKTGGFTVPFRPNAAQRALLTNLHNRNVILKARQLGFSTVINVMGLDHALFIPDQSVVMIAHTEAAALDLFRNKIKFAYDNLPASIREKFPLKKKTESMLEFAHNGSTIQVAVGARSGTFQFIHVSEFGKIAATMPGKASEVVSGSLQAVSANGMIFIESTAEGQEGAFYEMVRRAERKWRQKKRLTPIDYRFHFFAWWQEPTYCLSQEDAAEVIVTLADHEYLDGIEDETGATLDQGQRAWYVNKRDEEFAHDPSLMWREYPSTPAEPWKTTTEGRYLHAQVFAARAQGRIGDFPHRDGVPVYGFWDIGASDTQVCWLMQEQGEWDTWIDYREANGEGFLPFFNWIDKSGYQIGGMYLPHDASNMTNSIEDPNSIISQARAARPSWTWHVVPRVTNRQHGIDMLRLDFATYRFNEATTSQGILHCENYKRKWMTTLGAWGNEPDHNEASHGVDAIRQKAQAVPRARALRLEERRQAARGGRRASGLTA